MLCDTGGCAVFPLSIVCHRSLYIIAGTVLPVARLYRNSFVNSFAFDFISFVVGVGELSYLCKKCKTEQKPFFFKFTFSVKD